MTDIATRSFRSPLEQQAPRTGRGVLKVRIAFNSAPYQSNDTSAWRASDRSDVLAAHLGLPREIVETLAGRGLVFTRAGARPRLTRRPARQPDSRIFRRAFS